MASLLVLRLCQDDSIDENLHIALNDFTDGLVDILGGYHTVIQLKTFYDMTAPEQTALDILIGKITSAPDLISRMGRIHRFRSILTKYERKDELNLTGYDTPDDIEIQLLALDTGFN